MKIKLLTALIIFLTLFLTKGIFADSSLAAKLTLDPSSKTVTNNESFSVAVKIDTESINTLGAKATINFDGSSLSLDGVVTGNFYPTFNYASGTGIIEINSYATTSTDYKTGTGTLATITFKAKKDTGTSNITFLCTNNQSKIMDTSAVNIINCSAVNQTIITFSSGGVNPTDTPLPTPTATGGTGGGGTNSCGGTCGSNSNCDSGLYCYLGYCRNPNCPSDTDCNCSVVINKTATPKATVKTTTKPKKTATPKPGVKTSPSPYVIQFLESPVPSEEPLIADEELVTEEPVGLNNRAISMIIGATALILFLIGFALMKRKKKIAPPINEIPSVFPQNSWPVKPQNDNPPFPSAPTFGPPADLDIPVQPMPPVEPINPPVTPIEQPPVPQTPVVPPTLPQEPPTVY